MSRTMLALFSNEVSVLEIKAKKMPAGDDRAEVDQLTDRLKRDIVLCDSEFDKGNKKRAEKLLDHIEDTIGRINGTIRTDIDEIIEDPKLVARELFRNFCGVESLRRTYTIKEFVTTMAYFRAIRALEEVVGKEEAAKISSMWMAENQALFKKTRKV